MRNISRERHANLFKHKFLSGNAVLVAAIRVSIYLQILCFKSQRKT